MINYRCIGTYFIAFANVVIRQQTTLAGRNNLAVASDVASNEAAGVD